MDGLLEGLLQGREQGGMMDKFLEWEKTCLRKVKMTDEHADLVITGAKPGTLRKYYCPHCFGWHVTSKVLQNKVVNGCK